MSEHDELQSLIEDSRPLSVHVSGNTSAPVPAMAQSADRPPTVDMRQWEIEPNNTFRATQPKNWRKNMSAVLRLKMVVNSVKSVSDHEGNKTQEELGLNAVYSNDEGSANRQWSKWTPAASLTMSISNAEAFGKVLPGQFVFVDITPCEKDSI